jgi:uncharacterized protein
MSSRTFRIGRSLTGLGPFAIKPIKRGVYIATYRGRRITTEARGAKYQYELNKRWTIDGSPRWNVARYINHSCRPNAKPVERRGGIVIAALRRIEPGEEITYDYGRQYVEYFWRMVGAVVQDAAERELFVAGEIAAANGPNKLGVQSETGRSALGGGLKWSTQHVMSDARDGVDGRWVEDMFEGSTRWPRRSCGTAGGARSQFNRVARQLNERSRETLGFEIRAERDLMLVLHRPIELTTQSGRW